MTGGDLKSLRKSLSLNQSEMGERLAGSGLRTVQSWESGERNIPRWVDELVKYWEQH